MQPRTPRRHVPSAPRRRGAWSLTAGAALATVALAACALVPPVAVNDPLGLHGATVEVVFGGGAAVLAPLAADGADDVTFTFDDVDPVDLPLSPGRLTNAISVATATLDAPEPDAPETITLSDIGLELWLWHGAGSYDAAQEGARVQTSVKNAGPVTLTRGACTATECAYAYAGDAPAFGVVRLTGGDVGTVLTISSQPPEPNAARVRVTVRAEPDGLAGRTLTIELDAFEGSIGL